MAKRLKNQSGFTLLEVMLAVIVSSGILGALFVFIVPWVTIFSSLITNNGYRNDLVGVMDTIEKEASGMLSTYVDPTQCYAVCMADGNSNRIYYYWDNAVGSTYRTLYRKKESTSLAIACSGGKVFARNLKYASTSFSQISHGVGQAVNSLLTVNLVGKGDQAKTNDFPVYNVIFPELKERKFLFTEGFECNTLANGWVVNAGAASTWTVAASNAGYGKYLVVDSQAAAGQNTSTIQVTVDLARTTAASVSFNYFNDGTIGVPDSFVVDYYDGSAWHTVFSDASGTMQLAPQFVQKDLSAYTFAQSSQVRFSGSLRTIGAHWYVDQIQIFSP